MGAASARGLDRRPPGVVAVSRLSGAAGIDLGMYFPRTDPAQGAGAAGQIGTSGPSCENALIWDVQGCDDSMRLTDGNGSGGRADAGPGGTGQRGPQSLRRCGA